MSFKNGHVADALRGESDHTFANQREQHRVAPKPCCSVWTQRQDQSMRTGLSAISSLKLVIIVWGVMPILACAASAPRADIELSDAPAMAD